MRVKIYGAGSIGNHLTQASRRMGWQVTVVERDQKALDRMKNDIYPTRYGAWDPAIEQYIVGTEPKGAYDIMMIGTPPNVRVQVAMEALKEKPKLMLLEKPLCGPEAKGLKQLIAQAKKQKTILVMGYDHGVAESIDFVVSLIKKKQIGDVLTLDVEFREHWGGILKAHPWLKGPQDSYLAYTALGGGASGEHSHALHLWQYLARVSGMGTWKEVGAVYDMQKKGKMEYDAIAAFTFVTDKKKIGRVIQDVVTQPTRKWARLQGSAGYIEWYCNGDPRGDVVKWKLAGAESEESRIFDKKRPDDFYRETLHIDAILKRKIKPTDSPIVIDAGVRVMEVLKTVYAKRGGGSVRIRPL
jgi:predicted dehydrogenase